MRVVAVVQARMGSTRLPGKVLIKLGEHPVLHGVVRRLRRSSQIEETVVATTGLRRDDCIADLCASSGIACFRGSEADVLDRYYHTARAYSADVVIRVTSDCPLIDPSIVDKVVLALHEQHADFACNVWPRTYPRGLDAEAFTFAALEQAWKICEQSHQREHVTPLFYERPDLFRSAYVCAEQDYSRHRWTLDTPEDLHLLRAIYSHFEDDSFGWRDVLALVERSPELSAINAHVVQKTMHLSSSPSA